MMDEMPYVLTLTKFDGEGNQYVKAWRVTQATAAWVEERLGMPHAESLATNDQAVSVLEQMVGSGVIVTVAGREDDAGT